MAAAGTEPFNKFIVNIQELQNVVTSASGGSALGTLQQQVAQIQEMVNYTDKIVKANTLAAFSGTTITVANSLALTSNATLTVGGTSVGGAGSASTQFGEVSTVGYYSSFTNYFSTVTAADVAISFQVGSPPVVPLELTAGGGVRFPIAGTPGAGKYLTCLDAAGTAEWQTPAIPSDLRFKEDIQPLGDYATILNGIRGVRFRWTHGGGRDVGVIAQDVRAVMPEAVVEGTDGGPHLVHYHKIIPVLVEAVKALGERVAALESLKGQ
jgi:hypothetical protein